MRDWLMELCPEMVEWQADLIVDHVERLVRHEREEFARVASGYDATPWKHDPSASHVADMVCTEIAKQIRARGEKK